MSGERELQLDAVNFQQDFKASRPENARKYIELVKEISQNYFSKIF